MPEGPEVKIVSDYLNRKLENKEITSFSYCSKPYKIKYGKIVKQLNQYTPFHFSKFFCIGKSSFLKLDHKNYFSFHLGMTGKWSEKKEKHTHLSIQTSDKFTIYFTDTRRFGNIKLINNIDLKNNYFKYGDLLNNDTPIEEFTDHLIKNIKSSQEICKILLNQKYFCGVGNYLKSEILYKAKIHPHKKWHDLNRKDILNLCKFTKSTMIASYNSGGAELRDFKNPKKDSKLKLLAYGKESDPKGRLIINDITNDKRRTFWCPEIQN
tara:strand:+ start:580 stop:1377 length:798 start_codon:yes stop_codon:yes gene_type:complete